MSDSVVGIELPRGLFVGKTAIVTGASRGVGRATALRLAEAGANVVVNYLSNSGEAAETVAECKTRGVDAVPVGADVSDTQERSSLLMPPLRNLAVSIC